VATFDLRHPRYRDPHPGSHLLLGQPTPLAHLTKTPSSGLVQHLPDGSVERLPTAGRLHGTLQMTRLPPAPNLAHDPISFWRSFRYVSYRCSASGIASRYHRFH